MATISIGAFAQAEIALQATDHLALKESGDLSEYFHKRITFALLGIYLEAYEQVAPQLHPDHNFMATRYGGPTMTFSYKVNRVFAYSTQNNGISLKNPYPLSDSASAESKHRLPGNTVTVNFSTDMGTWHLLDSLPFTTELTNTGIPTEILDNLEYLRARHKGHIPNDTYIQHLSKLNTAGQYHPNIGSQNLNALLGAPNFTFTEITNFCGGPTPHWSAPIFSELAETMSLNIQDRLAISAVCKTSPTVNRLLGCMPTLKHFLPENIKLRLFATEKDVSIDANAIKKASLQHTLHTLDLIPDTELSTAKRYLEEVDGRLNRHLTAETIKKLMAQNN